MSSRPTTPRIAPLPRPAWDERVRTLLERVPGGLEQPFHVFTTLAYHPELLRRWLPFGTVLLGGELPARDRELLILRTAWNCRAAYEWGHHAGMFGMAAGLGEQEIARVPAGPEAAGWEPFDAVLLRAADELHADACLADATWRALATRYDERQLIEVPMVVGHYHLIAFVVNSLGVEPDPGSARLPG
jgi:alkylhydroperoxidase family enzyme